MSESESHVRLFAIPWTVQAMDSPGQNTGVDIAFPFSRGSSQPRNRTGSPALQVDSLLAELWWLSNSVGETNTKSRTYSLPILS